MSVSHVVSVSSAAEGSLPGWLRRRSTIVTNATADVARVAPIPIEKPLSLLVASRWNSWKGHRTLLLAWKEAKIEGRLLVAGGPPPGGKGIDVPEMARELNIIDSIEIIGETSELGAIIDRSHYLIVPSDEPEPFGLVAIEAFARGRPVVGSEAGGLGGIIDHRVNGYKYPNKDYRALAEVLRSLSIDDAVAKSADARAKYLATYSPSAFESVILKAWGKINGD
ncbi:glycosyltransferase family 4 protein [Salinibacterium sp. G-O1]|nr:glycosyltransferase family 4 protein [Salinibacterium sp. G-O1]MDJ0335417.1 glycosyltransferase family 4 protein [Salinibacterium sp. G-O1]